MPFGSSFHGTHPTVRSAQRTSLMGGGTHGSDEADAPLHLNAADQLKLKDTLGGLHEPAGALNLVQLARAEFKTIDKDHDGTIYGTEMYSAITNDKLSQSTREAAALLYRRFHPALPNSNHSWAVDGDDLSNWQYLVKLHDDFNERNQFMRNYTIGCGIGGAVLGGMITLATASYVRYLESRLPIAIPLGALAGAGLGTLVAQWAGRYDLNENLRRYDSLLSK